jgi:hypothetical protein
MKKAKLVLAPWPPAHLSVPDLATLEAQNEPGAGRAAHRWPLEAAHKPISRRTRKWIA